MDNAAALVEPLDLRPERVERPAANPLGATFADHRAVLGQSETELAPALARPQWAARHKIVWGGKLLLFGHRGGAAAAHHIPAELVVRFRRDRPAIAALALTTDTSILTAAANDIGYDQVFARQVEALARPGDLVLGITTSGRSPNVLAGLRRARDLGVETAVLTGQGGSYLDGEVDHVLAVPSSTTARIQEVHLMLAHALCDGLERHRLELAS
jgi:D-sedoheptulose 7-phosphate isomerase